tara:strand:- start:462 stop:683 length:222 start_codon:yes stop_codon:yes gene_type:complete
MYNKIVGLGGVGAKKLSKETYLKKAEMFRKLYKKFNNREKLPNKYKNMTAQDFDEEITYNYRMHDYYYTNRYK